MTIDSQRALLRIAREAIEEVLIGTPSTTFAKTAENPPDELKGEEGAFVTLKQRGLSPMAAGSLRGCIGNIISAGPLYKLIKHLACESAFHDPRFQPLRSAELTQILIEISILTVPKPISSPTKIVVGRDGVLLYKGMHRSVFLPQVAVEQGWDREEMLNHLAMKAGLYPSAWQQESCRFEVFQAEIFQEE